MNIETQPAGGVLPAQHLRRLVEDGSVRSAEAAGAIQIQPASIDLRLGTRAWRVRASFLPGSEHSVTDRLSDMAMHEIDLSAGAVLERGCVYVAELQEHFKLPSSVRAIANAKSTTGRLDVFTRLIANKCAEFDVLPAGYEGPTYVEISPGTFSLLVRAGSRLNQVRLLTGNPTLAADEVHAMNEQYSVIDPGAVLDDTGIRFSVDLERRSDRPVGYRAKRHCGLIDIDRPNSYDASDFWDELRCRTDELILDPGAFYILVSREAVRVPPSFAAEMTAYLPVVGEFRVHYAGFFDPGFGYGLPGNKGARSVLEVRCHETPFALRNGQVVGRLKFERMLEDPEVTYGEASGANYQGQDLQLAKHFRRE